MAECARCGAVLEPGAPACPACGAPGEVRVTAPHGSQGERPRGSGTLLLGSGVPILGPAPSARSARALSAPEPPASRKEPHRRRDALVVRQRALRAEPPAEDAPEAPAHRPFDRRRLWLLAPVLAALALGAFLALRSRGAVVVGEARFDPMGRPRLVLRCPSCPDGTTLSFGAESATVQGGRAELGLAPPIALGRQRASIEVRAPGRSPRNEQLQYDVSYIVSPDQRGLAHPEPKLALVFDAKPEVTLVVDGRVVEPGPSGLRRFEVPVRAELTGPAKDLKPLKKTIPYLVKPTSGEAIRGEIEVVLEIVPLSVDAPGESIVLEGTSFVLSGSTGRDGMITVEGRPITVDPAGRFSQLMSVSAVGTTTVSVRATAPGRAPRFFPIRVKRVASLAAEAAEFERRAEGSYAAISDDVEQKKGWAVVLEGKVSEIRSDGYVSSLLLDVSKGCKEPPCPVRLALGEKSSLRPGASVIAYGYLAGKSADPATGRGMPEVRVEFLRGKE